MISPTAQQALDYYGGAELWKNSRQIEAEVSVTGLAFVLKRRPYFDHARIVLDIDEQHCRLRPIGRHEQITGVLDRKDVWLEDANGTATTAWPLFDTITCSWPAGIWGVWIARST